MKRVHAWKEILMPKENNVAIEIIVHLLVGAIIGIGLVIAILILGN